MTVYTDSVLDFYELEAELKKLKAVATPAEAHGILCGQLSGGEGLDIAQWFNRYLANIGHKGEPWQSSRDWFYSLHRLTLAELTSDQLGFMPLLPDDEDPLDQRLGSLAEWCSGFLAGFGTSASNRSVEEFNQEILDALKDIQQISQVDPEPEEDETEGEAAYFEVLEYVRMAALLVFTEFALKPQTPIPPNTTIH